MVAAKDAILVWRWRGRCQCDGRSGYEHWPALGYAYARSRSLAVLRRDPRGSESAQLSRRTDDACSSAHRAATLWDVAHRRKRWRRGCHRVGPKRVDGAEPYARLFNKAILKRPKRRGLEDAGAKRWAVWIPRTNSRDCGAVHRGV